MVGALESAVKCVLQISQLLRIQNSPDTSDSSWGLTGKHATTVMNTHAHSQNIYRCQI